MDILCSLSRSLVHVVLPVMRKLYSRFAQAPIVNARLLLPLVKFFINHGMYDIHVLLCSVLSRIVFYKTSKCGDLQMTLDGCGLHFYSNVLSVFIFVGDSEMYDSETPISVFFGQVLSAKFNE